MRTQNKFNRYFAEIIKNYLCIPTHLDVGPLGHRDTHKAMIITFNW